MKTSAKDLSKLEMCLKIKELVISSILDAILCGNTLDIENRKKYGRRISRIVTRKFKFFSTFLWFPIKLKYKMKIKKLYL